MTKILRETLNLISKEEINVVNVKEGKHIVLRLQYHGAIKTFVRARTPSDPRSDTNFLGDLRRWKRNIA
jgi:hypothetical protein